MEKICFKCGLMKPLDDYYVHKQMGDGHLNKCKTCTKKDSEIREKELRKSPEWVEKEKIRAREKYNRLNYKEKHKPKTYKGRINTYRISFPEKFKAVTSSQSIAIEDGKERHHWSYNKEHYKDIIPLSKLEHAKLHRYIQYDQERMMYRRCDNGELLDTKERHIEFYESLKSKP